MNIQHLAAAAAAAITAFAAAPALAATGHVDGAYIAGEGDRYSEGFQASGAFSAPVGGWAFSVDGIYGSYSDLPGGDDDFYSAAARVGQAGKTGYYGAYVALGSTFDTNVQEAGVVLQGYYDKWTATARAGIGTFDIVDSDNTVGGLVGLTYHPRDDVAVGVEVGMLQISSRPDAYVGRLNVEWAPKILPVSVFAGESWHDNDYGTSRRVMSIGFRYNFGTMSIKERDQSGGNLGQGTLVDAVFAR